MPIVQELHVNGAKRAISADSERSLLSVLREDLDLTGTKYGCGEGQCGACTVLIDGTPMRSCHTTLGEVAGRPVQTIESLAPSLGELHPIQRAFLKHEALQCSYCTSGMVMSAYALLKKTPAPSEGQIIRAMNGNICRCGTYQRIMDAIKDAAAEMKSKS